MDNLGNMKSLENCQIVCNNAALATGSQPGLQFPCGGYEAPRVERRGSSGRAGKISSRRATANIATAGIGSRLFILACYFYSVPLRLPRLHFAIRVFEGRKDGHLCDSSLRSIQFLSLLPFYLRVSFRETTTPALSRLRRNCLDCLDLFCFFLFVFSSIVNYRGKDLFRFLERRLMNESSRPFVEERIYI